MDKDRSKPRRLEHVRKTRISSVAGLSAVLLVLGMVAAVPAFAAPTCTLAADGVTLNVTTDGGGTTIKRLVSSDPLLDDTIVVSATGSSTDVCPGAAGSEHTVFDINSINVSGNGPLTIDLTGGDFAPGFTTEDGTDEIEFFLASSVILTIQGTDAVDDWSFGLPLDPSTANSPTGIGMNSDSDADIVGGTNAAPATLATAVTANGGAANDTFVQKLKATETLNGGAGTDTVDYSARTTALQITIGAGADDGANVPGPGENDNVGADIETVIGGTAADVITVLPATSVLKYRLEGGAGDDTLTGADGRDTLLGGAGVDTLTAGGGRDSLDGGLGNDIETGGVGNDTFDQGNVTNGADTLTGGDGTDAVKYSLRTVGVRVTTDGTANDGECTTTACAAASEGDNVKADVESLYGSKVKDVLIASGTGNVRMSAGAGADELTGAGGNDRLLGGAGNDIIKGGAGDDYLSGDADDDTLTGGADKDTLLGGTGNDEMNGEAGIDRLSGSSGNDKLWGDGTNPSVKDTLVGGSQTGTTGDLCQRDLKDLLSGCEGRATGTAPIS
jgi:Ca2+-binding RTX toxin-like protein